MEKKIVYLEFDGWKNPEYKSEAKIVGDIQLIAYEIASKLYMKKINCKEPIFFSIYYLK